MKKYIALILTAFITMTATAQSPKNDGERAQRGEQIKALKIAYFTEKVGLTPNESEKFWPVYNQYWSERHEIAHRKRDMVRQFENGASKAEIAQYFDASDAENSLQRRYADKFVSILSPDKVAKLLSAEESFKFVILKQSGLRR